MKRLMAAAFLLCFSPAHAVELPDDSLYQITTKWTNQDGKVVELKDFAGQPILFSMVYLTCQYSCPTVISHMQEIQSQLAKAKAGPLRVVILSFDPATDKPPKLKAYMKKHKLDSKDWTFLAGKTDAEVREVAAALNFKYEKAGPKDYSHSFMILALDKTGIVRSRIDQVNQNKIEMVNILKSLQVTE